MERDAAHGRRRKKGKVKTFTVVEYSSYYAVRHNATGREAGMGDGVDTLFTPTNRPMSPGSEHFRKTWERVLNHNSSDTLEAYFPDLVK